MLDITITTPRGKILQRSLELGFHTIGRSASCDIQVRDKSMADEHAAIILSPEKQALRAFDTDAIVLKDETRVRTDSPLRVGDTFRLGECELKVTKSLITEAPRAISPAATLSETTGSESALAAHGRLPTAQHQSESATAPETARYAALTPVRKIIQEKIQLQLDLYKRNLITDMSAEELRTEARRAAEHVIKSGEVEIPADTDPATLVEEVVAEAIGLGPIEPLLADESVSEVMVNGPESVYVERAGRLVQTEVRFISDHSLMSAIERIVTPLGRRIDEGVPMVDARLPDGSRVNAIIPPLSLTGPILTIRKFSKQRFDMQRLVEIGSLSPQMVTFLKICVEQRRNIVISGGTGSGKTTFLNALSDYIPGTERIVTIEDAAELRLGQQHVISLEARPPNVEGKGHVAIRDLVRNALRMRPDRIVVGECRGGEALDMLQAMNTGHDGSMTTGHANAPRDLLSRLEVMVLMSGMDLPVRAIREQIASAVNVIVHQTRFRDGKRRITSIVEVDGIEGDVILLQKLFEFRQQGIGPNGEIQGEYVGLGCAPHFYAELESAGIAPDRSLFNGRWQAQQTIPSQGHPSDDSSC